jgi:hypothetical protein
MRQKPILIKYLCMVDIDLSPDSSNGLRQVCLQCLTLRAVSYIYFSPLHDSMPIFVKIYSSEGLHIAWYKDLFALRSTFSIKHY